MHTKYIFCLAVMWCFAACSDNNTPPTNTPDMPADLPFDLPTDLQTDLPEDQTTDHTTDLDQASDLDQRADIPTDLTTDTSVDMPPPQQAPLQAFYDAALQWRPQPNQIVVASDDTLSINNVHLRRIEFGFIESGFPDKNDRFDVQAQLYIAVDDQGRPTGNTNQIALSLYAENQTDEGQRGAACAALTGHICVVASSTVLSPGRLESRYPNEHAQDQPIEDSNTLQFVLERELQRGTDRRGNPLSEPYLAREYIAHITRASMYLITATQQLVVDQGIASTAPNEFLVVGHSKWGGTAAQLLAFDPRVIGGMVAGWPLDWLKWLELAKKRWLDKLGVEMFDAICSTPCGWTSTPSYLSFFQSSRGQQWLQQFDYKMLAQQGYFANKRIVTVRNNTEAHPIDTEQDIWSMTQRPQNALYLPGVGHTIRTPVHGAMWRHWIRHVFDGAPTLDLTNAASYTLNAQSFEAQIEFDRPVLNTTIHLRVSTDENYGALDQIPNYQNICQQNSTCSQWQKRDLTITQNKASLNTPINGAPNNAKIAAIFTAQYDDGSGDPVLLSSTPTIISP